MLYNFPTIGCISSQQAVKQLITRSVVELITVSARITEINCSSPIASISLSRALLSTVEDVVHQIGELGLIVCEGMVTITHDNWLVFSYGYTLLIGPHEHTHLNLQLIPALPPTGSFISQVNGDKRRGGGDVK